MNDKIKHQEGDTLEQTIDRSLTESYNLGVEHCIVTIKDFYNGVFNVPSDIDEIIKKLEKLKSK